jgi:hypothetical protein
MKEVTVWSPFGEWECFHGCQLVIARRDDGEWCSSIGVADALEFQPRRTAVRETSGWTFGGMLKSLGDRLGIGRPRVHAHSVSRCSD